MSEINYNSRKIAYLTFDDGPSDNTVKILQLLDFYKVRATFFVIGDVPNRHLSLYNEILKKGHGIGMHTFTHDYSTMYASLANFKADLERLENILMRYIGFIPSIYRFPGGSSNKMSTRYGGINLMEKLKKEIEKRGYKYFDWDVDCGDTKSYLVSADQIIENVLNNTMNKEKAIILLHDSPVKTTTVQALPEIIIGLKRQGFEFKILS
ncbi:polysaccharide deacetylase family protein [Lederbergia wuyishanensis]|uniref:Peptidoglycan/xylan/chitin deacetylase (PgdA/CDA1 family) n=1 Tax=Lederbergia wuyishanensis TaxID=1347903 RepID=A0ABU0D6Y6_9BACI|nr:polysaccharide deacetylase family protein [Lederbergia wuyishanensis]MCJ8008854.1 polysaccharide deacetylase [Lederbergia wuyishanensis]MDQ0344176.1 peptidoglycan/xylan/chitin deacetylase (PgdA/CDA1 family) [Lederbergia wuyishanensis]